MWVKLPSGQKRLLAYEMNVHAGESISDFRTALQRWTQPIRRRLRVSGPFGIAPRFGRGILRDLAGARARRNLAAELRSEGLVPYSVNAFPLGDFQARRVKERVFHPPWTHRERARLTCKAADVLADLLPPGVDGSISTLGGTYRPWGHGPREHARIGAGYLRVVQHLIELERRTGRRIVLAAEPEPDTTFESANHVVGLFEEYMLPQIRDALARPLHMRLAGAERLLREFFTINLDACHQSVRFRDSVAEWKTLEQRGLRVGKLHMTNALALKNPARAKGALRALRRYDEPRYLHQFAMRLGKNIILEGRDLGDMTGPYVMRANEIRVHFHVPISEKRIGLLTTTQDETLQLLAHAVRHPAPPHFVIETYTWPLIARKAGDAPLINGIAKEFRWALRAMRARPIREQARKSAVHRRRPRP